MFLMKIELKFQLNSYALSCHRSIIKVSLIIISILCGFYLAFKTSLTLHSKEEEHNYD